MTMSTPPQRVLVLGYGNPGRGDDGLGPAAAAAIAAWHLPGWTVEENYQLNIEDAAQAAQSDLVIFVDAAASGPEPFQFRSVEPSARSSFSSHYVHPETILAICRDCFGQAPPAWLIAIRAYQFELGDPMSEKATHNLAQALEFLRWRLGAGPNDPAAQPCSAPPVEVMP